MEKENYAKHIEQNHLDLKNVLQHYPISPKETTLLYTRGGRSKWLIKTETGDMYLRQEYINPKRMLFIAGAHRHLQHQGLPIAGLVPTNGGGLCLSGGDHAYLLTEAVSGEAVLYYDKMHMIKTMEFMAEFHQASKGYIPVAGSKKRTRTGKWHKLYQWKLQELENNRKLAQEDTEDLFSRMFLEHADQMLERGYEALKELDESCAVEWTHEVIEAGMFCQQDFTLARLTMMNDRVFMKDLHSITIDLPARDLRVLLNKIMKKLSVWDQDLMCDLLGAYDQVYPLSRDKYRVLWTDLKFPHLFCGMVHKYYLGQKKSWGDEKYLMNFQNMIGVEKSKELFLTDFDKMISKIKGGEP